MKKFKRSTIWLCFGILISIVAIFTPLVTYFVISKLSLAGSTLTNLGTVGDYLGGTTFLLALASILFVISSIMIQKEELELSRDELAKSIDEQKKSNETMQIQQFETSFYNLINLLNRVKVETMDITFFNSEEHITCTRNIVEYFNESTDIMTRYIEPNFIYEYFAQQNPDLLFDDYNECYRKLKGDSLKLNDQYLDYDGFRKKLNGQYDNKDTFTIKELSQVIHGSRDNEFVKFIVENFYRIRLQSLQVAYLSFSVSSYYSLTPFIETFKSIVGLVDSRDEIEDKNFYLRILRGQLNPRDVQALKTVVDASTDNELIEYSYSYPILALRTGLLIAR